MLGNYLSANHWEGEADTLAYFYLCKTPNRDISKKEDKECHAAKCVVLPHIRTWTHILANLASSQAEMVEESRSDWLPFLVLQVNPILLKKQASYSLPLLIRLSDLSKSHKRGLLPWESRSLFGTRYEHLFSTWFHSGRKQCISTEVKYHCDLWVSITKRPLGRWRSSWHRYQCRQIRLSEWYVSMTFNPPTLFIAHRAMCR